MALNREYLLKINYKERFDSTLSTISSELKNLMVHFKKRKADLVLVVTLTKTYQVS